MAVSKHYILASLMASFAVKVDSKADEGSRVLTSSDVDLSEYLAAYREYADLVIRPLIVETDDDRPPSFTFSHEAKAIFANYNDAYYHVEITSNDIDQYSLVDALNAAMALLEIREDEDLFFIPVEPTDINDQRITKRTLLSRRNAAVGLPAHFDDYIDWSRRGFDYRLDDLIWMLATTLIDDEVLLYAALFVRESLRDYQFRSQDDVLKAIAEIEQHPDTISEGVRIENAIHNCYKAIEAIYGGNLPQKASKIVKSFEKKGIDATELVGYKIEEIEQQPAIDKIINLRSSRNFKSAHGRIKVDRKSTYYELMDFQQLARYMVTRAIYPRTGVTILYAV
jgi:hypothetical protein